MVSDTLTLSVRDCDELRGYLVKHYKIHTTRHNNTDYFFITPKRMFENMLELVNHYLGEMPARFTCPLVGGCLCMPKL